MRKQTQKCCAALFERLRAPKLFQALCDPTRLAILCDLLAEGEPKQVGAIGGCCPIDLSVVSRHLRVLHEAGVLEREKRGKEVFYTVAVRPLARTLRKIASSLEGGRS